MSAELSVPLGVARVLVSDLRSEGLLVMHVPTLDAPGGPDREILERLLIGLRAR